MEINEQEEMATLTFTITKSLFFSQSESKSKNDKGGGWSGV